MPPTQPLRLAASRVALLLAALAALLAAACAPQPTPPPAPAQALWEAFGLASAGAPPAFSLRASLNYAGPDQQSRVVMKFWGNVTYPLRLDMSTSFGAPVAYWREDREGLLTYAPGAQTAWRHRDALAGASALGLPFPLTLRDLAGLATGAVRSLAPERFLRAEATPEGGWAYEFARGESLRRLVLDSQARPVRLEGRASGREYVLRLADFGETGLFPGQAATFYVDLKPDVSAVLRIKSMDAADAPWPAESLALPLPPDTRLRDLTPGQAAEPLDFSRN
ncbi:MAG: hypothetical protein AB1916_00740 [Thermodesulfobacteriota bacterium]